MHYKVIGRLLFHVAVTVVYGLALYAFQMLPPMPLKSPHEHFAGRWKYLTYWNLVAHFVFFLFSIIVDLTLSLYVDFSSLSPGTYQKLARIRDKFYAGIALPYGVFVVAVFWILYSIDRELIFPRVLDAVFPSWLNHVSHTLILPVLLVETYISRHKHPMRKDGIKITATFGIIYIVWVLYLALVMDIWPYPILQIMNWGQRIAFFGVGIIFLSLLYLVGERLNICIWGDGIVAKNK